MASVVTTGFSVSALLRAVWPTGTAKHAARVAKISHRTVEDWLSDRCSPNAKTLVAMAQADDRLKAELISILSKGLPTHVPSLEEEPSVVDRRRGSMDGNEVRPPR
jgi:transcriptional regulator with XRE-family HTH domain